MVKTELNDTMAWHLIAKAWHVSDLTNPYVDALTDIISNKSAAILDSACGGGFPLIDLYNRGFTNIVACDADEQSISTLSTQLLKQNISLPMMQGQWQELSQKLSKRFDVVMNVDNAFVYMDGWSGDNFVSGFDEIQKRAKLVIQNFHDLCVDQGKVVIGLGKHYHPATTLIVDKMELLFDGELFEINSYGVLDWEKRENTWRATIESQAFKGAIIKKSYLLTKEEIMALMENAGFQHINILQNEDVYDDLIVGTKANNPIKSLVPR